MVRAWLWSVFAGDLKFVCSYRYRQPLSGSEQYHSGMVGTDGVTPSTGGLEYSQFINEIKNLRKVYRNGAKNPDDYEARRVGFMYSFDNNWNQQINSQTYQWNYFRHQAKYYAIFKSLNCPVSFIDSISDFTRYKIIVAPAYQLVDEKLCQKWMNFVQNGGNLILTSRSGQKDNNGHFFESAWTQKISSLIGGRVEAFDLMPDMSFGKIEMDSKEFKWNNWADLLKLEPKTEAWAQYSDQFYKGKAAVSYQKLGKGSVTFIGADTDEGDLEKEVVKKVFNRIQLPIVELPQALALEYRDGFGIAINYSSQPTDISKLHKGKLIIGTDILAPARVAVWEK
jgi:beta-galactosidase